MAKTTFISPYRKFIFSHKKKKQKKCKKNLVDIKKSCIFALQT